MMYEVIMVFLALFTAMFYASTIYNPREAFCFEAVSEKESACVRL